MAHWAGIGRGEWRLAIAAALFAILSMASTGSSWAADTGGLHRGQTYRKAGSAIPYLPSAPSKRAAAVWASEPCWRSCTAQCGAQFQACLHADGIDHCVASDNRCNLTCQKSCRVYGGPLLNWTD